MAVNYGTRIAGLKRDNTIGNGVMKKEIKEDPDKNVVMFPASKYFSKGLIEEDPIEQLLNEFEDEAGGKQKECQEETFKMREELQWGRLKHEELMELISEQLELLHDANKRLRYYLNDIEVHRPLDDDEDL